MAKFRPDAMQQIVIDGEGVIVPQGSTLVDVLPPEVSSIQTVDTRTGLTHLVPRSRFDMAVPAGFTTHLTPISKG